MIYMMTQQKKHRSRRLRWLAVLFCAALIGYLYVVASHAPALGLRPTTVQIPASKTTVQAGLDWPSYGEAAVGAEGYGVLATHGKQTPVPTASTAKIMLALSVLRVKPLQEGQIYKPVITLKQHDVDIYNHFVAEDGSVALVAAGENISEYQALQALLLPSANNMADSLAIWAFGSTATYTKYANSYAAQLGLNGAHFDDPSGYSPKTVSTAEDLIKLSLVAMENPVFSEIVAQPSAEIPVAGKIYNVNGLLGKHDIVGVKTGNTDEAGGVFVVASTRTINGKELTVVAAVMGGPNLVRAMLDSVPLVQSAKQNFTAQTILPKDSLVGSYTVPWSDKKILLKTTTDLQVIAWKGTPVTTTSSLQNMTAPLDKGSTVGSITAKTNGATDKVTIVASESIHQPSFGWRLTHPF